MTKYILNSGGMSLYPDKTKRFFAEMVDGLGEQPHILVCLFSRPREHWENSFHEFVEGYTPLFPDRVTPIFTMAMPDQFEKQVKESDAIMLSGGDDHLLLYWLRQFDLPALWEGKVIAGSSAGSDALVTHFWTCDWRKCMDGLGILPVKMIPHCNSQTYDEGDPRGPIDWEQAYTDLAAYGDTTRPIHKPEEGEYVVIEQ